MKITSILFLILLSTWCWAQSSDNVIKEGSATNHGEASNALIITYYGDIEKLIDRLKQDFGKGQVVTNNATTRYINYRKVVKPDWTENKINITFASISNESRHIITITCTDKENDYLIRGRDTQKKIKAYFQEVIEEK
jgi:hypothetical protein